MKPERRRRILMEALARHKEGRIAQARELYAKVLAADPNDFDAAHLDGTAAVQLGRMEEAVPLLERARRKDPRSAVCAMRLGVALNGVGRYAEAEKHLRDSLASDPALPEAWFHLGRALERLGRVYEAIDAASRAIAARPGYAEAHDHLGCLLAAVKGYPLAEPHFQRAVQADPKFARSWSNLGICLTYLGRLSEALSCLDRALALQPDLHHAHAGRGLALERMQRLREAIDAYGRAIAGDPRNFQARSARLLAWHYVEEARPEAVHAEALEFGRVASAARPAQPASAQTEPIEGRRIRLGMLSPNLRIHSVAFFLAPMLEGLDRSRFEVFLYHDHPRSDAMSERLKSLSDHWVVTAGLPQGALEARIRADRLDVLVDLAGHTDLNRMAVIAGRLAPVQATYLGYPDTTGLETMDFRLVDAITDPPGQSERLCSEKLVRFSPTAWCYEPPADAPEPMPRREGAPLTFGCFNNFAKVTDSALRAWARLLARFPDSRLLLKGYGLGEASIAGAARARMAQAGLPPDRVDLLERMTEQSEHLAAYARMDVSLDTFPYNGTTTTCEALWMGVPVVSLRGGTHASRVGASLLTAVGCGHWIAADWEDYVERAAALASDPQELARLRTELRKLMAGAALSDRKLQADRFGRAIAAMVAGRAAGQPSEKIAAEASCAAQSLSETGSIIT